MSYAYICNMCGIEVTDPDLDSNLDMLLGEYHGYSDAIKVAIKELARKTDIAVYYPADEENDLVQLCPKCDKAFMYSLKIKPKKLRMD